MAGFRPLINRILVRRERTVHSIDSRSVVCWPAVVGASAAFALGGARAPAVPPVLLNQTNQSGLSMLHDTSTFSQSQYAGGATIGDFNNDGFQDAFVFKGGDVNGTDRLYINNGNGTFTNQATPWGVALAHKGKGACTGDFNNDGWLDLFVTSAGPAGQPVAPGQNKLYRNNGNGTFSNIAAAAGVNTTNPLTQDSWASCFGDYDLDGDLDLFVGGFLTSSPSNVGNRLFRNNFIPLGTETFTDVTSAISLLSGVGPVACLSASFADMNGDRYPELLLGGDFKGVNSFVGSRYFKNDGDGTFTDLTVASGAGQEENGMGQTLGDFNNDQRLDWYVTSIYGFPPTNWTGNKLYRNLGNHQYTQYAAAADVDDGGYGWGAIAADLNHDGWLDIAETNGDSGGGQWTSEQSYLWINNGNDTFSEVALASGFSHFGKGRGLLQFDYDNDGDRDLLLAANNENLNFFRNDLPIGPDTHWLRVFLDTSSRFGSTQPLAPNGYGSKVYVTIGGATQMRSIDGGNSFLGVSELSAHFGVGSTTLINEVKVAWNDGSFTTLANVAVDQTITVSPAPPAQPCPADVSRDGAVGVDDLVAMIGAWGPCLPPPPDCAADITGDGTVDVDDLVAMVGAWGPCAP